jgi:hypothetical protein
MGFEDLIQLLVALAVMFGLFGGARKKKRGAADQQPRQRPPQRRRPEAPRTARLEVPGGPLRRPTLPSPTHLPSAPAPRPSTSDAFADEVYRMLSGELERSREESLEVEGASFELERRREDTLESRGMRTEVERSIPEEIRPVENVTEVEAYSLETLEPAGEASHREFHRKYDAPAPSAASPAAPGTPQRRLTLDVRSARQAMVWREILGPPKGME